MFSNHFTTNFSQNAPIKNFENWSIWTKLCGLLFWATLYKLMTMLRKTRQDNVVTGRRTKPQCPSLDKDMDKPLLFTLFYFLADRTNGRAIATLLRLSSVCNVMYCG